MKLIKYITFALCIFTINTYANSDPRWVKDSSSYIHDGEIKLNNADGNQFSIPLNKRLNERESYGRTPNIMVVPLNRAESFIESLSEGTFEEINETYQGNTPLNLENVFSLEGYNGFIESIRWSGSNMGCEGASAIEVDGVTFYSPHRTVNIFQHDGIPFRFNKSVNVYASNNPGNTDYGVPSGCGVSVKIKATLGEGSMDTFISKLPKKTLTFFSKRYSEFKTLQMSEVINHLNNEGILSDIDWSGSNYGCTNGAVTIDGKSFNSRISFNDPIIFRKEIRIFAENRSYGCGVGISGFSTPPLELSGLPADLALASRR